jgi:hypothetical protein
MTRPYWNKPAIYGFFILGGNEEIVMDHLQAIRAFARVVETGGFNRAAQSLQIPNATLSKAIQSLEKHLGVKLLERSTRRVSVTMTARPITNALSICSPSWMMWKQP